MSLQYVQTPATSLYSGMAVSDVTCRVTPYPVDLDGVKLSMTDFGTTGYFTIDPKISGYEEICSFTGLTDNGDGTATLTGLTRNLLGKSPYTASGTGGKLHGSSAVVVFSDNPQLYANLKAYIDGIALAGTVNATTSLQGLVQLPTTAQVNAGTSTGSSGAALGVTPDSLAASIYGLQLPSSSEKTFLTTLLASLTGTISPYAGRTAPSGYLFVNGADVSRITYANLLAVIAPSQTATMTIASPGVVTATAHGLVAGDLIHFTTTGGLPSGVTAGLIYYVLSTSLAANTFKFALSPEGTAVVTTGSQSGVHTLFKSAFGQLSSDLTTFRLPDLRGKSLLGEGATTNITLSFEGGAVNAGADTIAVPDGSFPSQGQSITLTTTGTLPAGLATATPYYVVRLSSTSIQLSTTQANANASTPVVINITDTGSAGGVHTITYALTARTVLGKGLGEETHGVSQGELASHVHTGGVGSINYQPGSTPGTIGTANTGSVGSDTQHNNMSPNVVINFIIKT